jgi:hypothetical protein
MKHITVVHDGAIVNWQLHPLSTQGGLDPNTALVLVGRDIAANVVLARGLPRTDYNRVYHVLPANRSDDLDVVDFLAAKRAGYQTVGWSYDDAGIGSLSDRRAVLHGIETVRQAEFIAWYTTHYPEVEVIFV